MGGGGSGGGHSTSSGREKVASGGGAGGTARRRYSVQDHGITSASISIGGGAASVLILSAVVTRSQVEMVALQRLTPMGLVLL